MEAMEDYCSVDEVKANPQNQHNELGPLHSTLVCISIRRQRSWCHLEDDGAGMHSLVRLAIPRHRPLLHPSPKVKASACSYHHTASPLWLVEEHSYPSFGLNQLLGSLMLPS